MPLKSLKFKKILFIASFVFLLFSGLKLQAAQAFNSDDNAYQLQYEEAVYQTDEMNLQSFVHETMKAVQGSTMNTIIGCITCPGGVQRNAGALTTVAFLIDTVYKNPPASSVEYFADIGSKLGIVSPAYAQEGLGFRRMHILLPLWKSFRNITYVFFILAFVVTGFAIMFRVKISPQAVITLQSALPNFIIGLILVTFSYAIVGLMIDIMFLANNIIIQTFKHLPEIVLINAALPERAVTSDIETLWTMLGVGLPAILALILFLLVLWTVPSAIIGAVTTGPLALVTAPTAFLIGGAIILVIIGIVCLIALIRLLWTLLKAYINVVLGLIFGPFQILIGTLPGSSATSSWFKNLAANLAVLPAAMMMVFIAGYIGLASLTGFPFFGALIRLVSGLQANPTTDIREIMEMIGDLVKGGVSATDLGASVVLVFVSFGILLLIPKVADIVQAAISSKPFAYGTALGETLGPVKAGGRMGVEKTLGGAPSGSIRKGVYDAGKLAKWW